MMMMTVVTVWTTVTGHDADDIIQTVAM